MRIILIILRILAGIGLVFISEESAATYWRYVIKLSSFQAFIIVSILGLCTFIFFWIPLYKKVFMVAGKWQKIKIIRWLSRKYNYYEKNRDKKIVKKIRTFGHFGLYIGGLIPFLLHPTLCTYMIFIQSRFGFICIWLGSITRLALYMFAGLKLIDLIF